MLDQIDKKILALLQENSRISNQELADRVALSPSPCLRRVKQLEQEGYINGYIALLNPEKIGLPLTIMTLVGLKSHSQASMNVFESNIKKIPEIIQCQLVTGQSADYIIKVIVPDMQHFHDFLLNKLTAIDGVCNVQSSFVLRNIVDKTSLPLLHLS